MSEDETGLIYMRARYMDPALGRFISEDPSRDGVNWFVYCGSNPVNLADPDGRIIWCIADLLALGLLIAATREYDNTVINIGLGIAAGIAMAIGIVLTIQAAVDRGGPRFRERREGIERWLSQAASQDLDVFSAIVAHGVQLTIAASYLDEV